MKIIIPLLTSKTDHPGLIAQKHALDKHGWTAEVVETPFVWGNQMKDLYNWLKANRRDFTHVLYCDAWDIMCFGTPDEFMRKLFAKFCSDIKFVGSAEKACFPVKELESEYPPARNAWKYINGGNWFAEIDYFMHLFETTHEDGVNDQYWLGREFCKAWHEKKLVSIDSNCEIFQSIAFEDDGDFGIGTDYRILNLKTGTAPLFFHGNGHTDMEWVYAAARKDASVLSGPRKAPPLSDTMKKIMT